MNLRFELLGPVQVRRNGRPVPLGSPKQRALLTTLLLEPNRVVSIDRLVMAVWDEEPPRSAVANLRTYVNRLRDTLGEGDRLTARTPGYVLTVHSGELDVTEFADALRQGRQALSAGRPEAALRHLSAALARWRGAPAEDVPRSAALGPRLDALAEQRCLALEAQAEARLMLGEHAEAVPELRETVAAHPTRERLWGSLMLALYRTGDSAAALSAYGQARTFLAEELGVEPGPELAELHRSVLNRDPALQAVPLFPVPDPSHPAPPPEAGQKAGPKAASAPVAGPRGSTSLVGRDPELNELLAAIAASPPRPVAVHGPAGVGKSALALHAVRTAAPAFPGGVFHVDLRALPRPGAYETLTRLLGLLGLADGQIAADLDDAVLQFGTATAERRVLVLLDNVTDEGQVRPLIGACPDCLFVITSRMVLAALDDVDHLPLAPLTDDAAYELLVRLCRRDRVDPEQVRRVARLCDNLPLALRIAGKRLAVRREWTLAAFADMLADEEHRLDLLTCGDLSVRSALDLDYQALRQCGGLADGSALALFHRLGERGMADCGSATAAGLLGCDRRTAWAALGRLADLRLMKSIAPDHYRMNDLTRLYAMEIARTAGKHESENSAAFI
ncbi:winged helix-turn-helix domain-containing protein [Microbispora sp. NEAU-D428]|uniref:AfsR/SARP family transcriptional regulator n=1 Tax=Microbispora sitophila TaxID=2771537 RepID=UPI001869345E|nr:BTAD domain-containing putative transcriptional regulator [Microbispora sitophila]MBE3008904.1 winged helix-turn-helix domain-containing protein [Microbispora sitophila]